MSNYIKSYKCLSFYVGSKRDMKVAIIEVKMHNQRRIVGPVTYFSAKINDLQIAHMCIEKKNLTIYCLEKKHKSELH